MSSRQGHDGQAWPVGHERFRNLASSFPPYTRYPSLTLRRAARVALSRPDYPRRKRRVETLFLPNKPHSRASPVRKGYHTPAVHSYNVSTTQICNPVPPQSAAPGAQTNPNEARAAVSENASESRSALGMRASCIEDRHDGTSLSTRPDMKESWRFV